MSKGDRGRACTRVRMPLERKLNISSAYFLHSTMNNKNLLVTISQNKIQVQDIVSLCEVLLL